MPGKNYFFLSHYNYTSNPMSSSNLVQELVQEMGPYNPALNFNSGMPMDNQGYNQMIGPQPQMQQMPQQMPQQMSQPMPQMYQPSNQGPDMMQPHPGMPPGQRPYMQKLPPAPEGYDMDDEDQMQEMMDLEHFGMDGGHRSFTDRAIDQGREGLFLAVVFFLLSLPQTDRFIQRTIPQVANKFYYLLALKGVILAVSFFLAKYFELI